MVRCFKNSVHKALLSIKVSSHVISAFDSWGMSGSTYGKSGYMLFYEKIKKKPIRIVKEAAKEGKEEVIEEVPF